MSTVNFSVPEDIKLAFNATFAGQNKSAVIADLMREAVERAQRQQSSKHAYLRILQRMPTWPCASWSSRFWACPPMVQPPHFSAEVAAVLARLKPGDAQADVDDLLQPGHETLATPEVYTTALQLALRHQHHLFNTLYHAVALHTPGASLITADQRYYDKGQADGRITLLANLRLD